MRVCREDILEGRNKLVLAPLGEVCLAESKCEWGGIVKGLVGSGKFYLRAHVTHEGQLSQAGLFLKRCQQCAMGRRERERERRQSKRVAKHLNC